MGYRRMTTSDLFSIFRRWHAGQSTAHIAKIENRDRKTIRNYLKSFCQQGFSIGMKLPETEIIKQKLAELIPQTQRSSSVTDQIRRHQEEITELIQHSTEPVKPKTAWLIIQEKYGLSGSYESFKKFIKSANIPKKKKSIIRIELPPGLETQIDYGKMGLHFDPDSNKNRTVYAFCGILSSSRYPFVEFCYKQDQQSFVESNVNMFEYYEGVTEVISLDNLKAGVIKPDLYDPKINRAYQDMAEHYGIFIDPCRVATPTDKGKVERIVPVVRELYRRLKHLHPTASLTELNKLAREWCREEYGMKEHGTTGVEPRLAYEQEEKAKLKSLPAERFEAPLWKFPKVHPDQFFSFNKKRYSLPKKYAGETVAVKQVKNKVFVYYNYKLIRQYFIPNKSSAYFKEDFPEVLREMMDGGYPKYLLQGARVLGENAYKLVESILSPHAYLNARRAQGVIELLKKYRDLPLFSDVCAKALRKGVKLSKTLKLMFEEEKEQQHFDFIEQNNSENQTMVRQIDYFFN